MAQTASGGSSRNYIFKIVLLGEGCVGKTSLVLRYVENKFEDKHITTLQAAYLSKKVNIGGKRVTLNIWDTAGQERFHALGPIYYRDSNGAILVYDITDEESFQKVKSWVKELRKMLGNDISLCIAGNKTDKEKERHVSSDEAQSFAASVGAKHLLTSAKLNRGVEEVFLEITKSMIERSDIDNTSTANKRSSTRKSVITVVDDHTDTPPKSGCC